MREVFTVNIACQRCPIGIEDDCMYRFRQFYGYSCMAVPAIIEWPVGLELKPELK